MPAPSTPTPTNRTGGEARTVGRIAVKKSKGQANRHRCQSQEPDGIGCQETSPKPGHDLGPLTRKESTVTLGSDG